MPAYTNLHGIMPPCPPLCKALVTNNSSWNSSTPLTFFRTEVDTHGMWSPSRPSQLRIPMHGLYTVIANVQWAPSAQIESEWGISVQGTDWYNTSTGVVLARTYTGYGTWHRQYIETVVNLRDGDLLSIAKLPSGRSSSTVNFTSELGGIRAMHLIVHWIAPNTPSKGEGHDVR
jgi:hypothetical protein